MKISREAVAHVAQLARLHFEDMELDRFTQQLNEILSFVEKLNELNTAEVPPTTHFMAIENVFREDVVSESFSAENVLANAPQPSKGSFQVPRIIE